MMSPGAAFNSVSDDDLLLRLGVIVRDSRRVEAELVAHVAEVDARRLYAREACPSMFAYCTERLGLSEPEAYLRIAAARASREHPPLLAMLADGQMHLSGIALLARHLTPENRDALLGRAAGRSKREIEALVAEIAPRADVPTIIRRLPVPVRTLPTGAADEFEVAPTPVMPIPAAVQLRPDGVDGDALKRDRPRGWASSGASVEARRAVVAPLSPGRYRIQFTASAELRGKLERLQALLRGAVPDGDMAAVVESAVDAKLRLIEARRFGRATRPRGGVKSNRVSDAAPEALLRDGGASGSAAGVAAPQAAVGVPARRAARHVPLAIRRAVEERDRNQCTYRDRHGRRCSARDGLEFHHRHPFGYGGSHSVDNVCLMCRAHNRHEAAADFGSAAGARRPERERPAVVATAADGPSSSLLRAE